MKTAIRIISLLPLFIVANSCKPDKDKDPAAYLQQVLTGLEKIESATYYEHKEVWQPGDTVAANSFCDFVKEYNNPSDTTIGAAYMSFDCEDSTKMKFGYDGNVRALIYQHKQEVVIDDFTARPLPLRPLSPPFFNYAKNIINYLLTTKDSIDYNLTDTGDHYYLKLAIHEDKQVEFFGKAHYIPNNPFDTGEKTSIYELWIAKSDNLPYKVRREMSHNISVATCSKVELNKLSIGDLNIFACFPAGYEIKNYGDIGEEKTKSALIGKKAPDWVLNDKDENSISLASFKGKVLLIQFTGIGCGPCVASIPFLKQLKEKHNNDDFDIVAIETWVQKSHSLQNYSNKNGLNYTLLNATDKVIKDYQTGRSAPIFFIVDKQQNIRKIMNGYNEEITDKEITTAISDLL